MRKKLRTIGIVFMFLIVGFCGCVNEQETPPLIKQASNQDKNFDVHEWGVFLKGYDCTDVMVATNSPETVDVKKPVIYFHSLENLTDVSVEIQSITNATVIPDANLDNSSILWDVTVENNTIISQNGTQYPYLFYEGEIIGDSAIVANITRNEDTTTYHIRNRANYTISNVFFIYLRYGFFNFSGDDSFEYVHFGELNPGEEVTLTNSSSENLVNLTEAKSIILNALISDGLTPSESNELLDYWESYLFSPSNVGEYTRVLYLIPQLVYDELLPLSITPQPEVIKRVGLFTITDIPVEIS